MRGRDGDVEYGIRGSEADGFRDVGEGAGNVALDGKVAGFGGVAIHDGENGVAGELVGGEVGSADDASGSDDDDGAEGAGRGGWSDWRRGRRWASSGVWCGMGS